MSTQPVRLLSGSRIVANISIDATLGRSNFGHVADDAKFLSPSQFRILSVEGQWVLDHVPEAVNETLCDGKPLHRRLVLADGMTISVGNSNKGISKFPLVVKLEGPPKSKPPRTRVLEPLASLLAKTKSLVATLALNISRISFGPVLRAICSLVRPVLVTLFATLVSVTLGLLRALSAGYVSTSGGGFGGTRARVHEGGSIYGTVILTIDGDRVCQGDGPYGAVVALVVGDKVVRGSSPYGEVIANLVDDKVVAGSSPYGDVIARVCAHGVVDGSSPYGNVIASVEGGGRMAGAAAAAFLLRM